MKRLIGTIVSMVLVFTMLIPVSVMADQGDSGYEGGISSGSVTGKTVMQYQEVSFITGEPVVFEGTLTVKKSNKQGTVNTTYSYSLKNTDRLATLTRTFSFTTIVTEKANGQKTEETTLTGKPSEVVKIDGITYTLKNYDFSRANIIDTKPAVNYFAGNTWGRKVYQTGASAGTVTVEATGSYYGYDQYWGTAEAIVLNYIIESDSSNPGGSWGGTAEVKLSSATSKQLKYVDNEPQIISFEGGYSQTQFNSSIVEYTAELPEFDSKGIATDNITEFIDTLKLESFPKQSRLPVPDISHLRGHWSEEDVKALFSLEIFKEDSSKFNPDEYITKAEFIAAMVEAAKEVPTDESASKTVRTITGSKTKNTEKVSPFYDVPVDSKYFTQIESAFNRGIVLGKGDGTLGANDYLNMADAITIFIKSIGLESLAPGLYPVTTFRDNDEIPDYAKRAAYAAQRIGLVRGDTNGYLNPGQMLTKGQAAAMINRFIGYMREDIRKDYRERIIAYR